MEIQPIEDFVFAGIVKRFSEVFGCRTVITTTNDKTKTLARLFDGKPVEYPYAFLTLSSFAENKESYVNRMLSRRGIAITGSNERVQTARLVPTNFTFEVEYHTNQFQGFETKTVVGFVRRWLFALKCGYLKFNIQYGRLETRIGVTLDESVSTPPLENKVEQEAAYKVTANLVVHGWMSESILGSQGVINVLDVQLALAAQEGYVFVPFT